MGIALAAPAQEAPIERREIKEIQPNSWIDHPLYWGTPNVCYAPGQVVKIGRTGPSPDVGHSALYTFQYPYTPAGAKCWISFKAGAGATINNPRGVDIDVFSSTAPGSCSGGSSSNYRDQNWGRLKVTTGGVATWVQTSGGLSSPVPCKPAGSYEWVELVAAGDSTWLSYLQQWGQGLVINYQ
ncbi:hypothetical protein QBC38DRAFT_487726 [Podospora fimiseda]|uniref:Ubiquitin 3 binding protein But2 C-terminal domain-containing protein n=1 Tax=Podospora fimiseda TaxID=252190 RepID=A0AAN7BHD7_9PEZI|nr:hypothetical protein QBC38DRAFT_487726 [Podospora fimiseda]